MGWVTRSTGHYEATYYLSETVGGRKCVFAMDIYTTNPRRFTMQNSNGHINKHGLGSNPQASVQTSTYSTFAVVRREFVRTY